MATKRRARPARLVNMRLGQPVEDGIDLIGASLGITHRVETVRFLVMEKARELGIVIPRPAGPEREAPPEPAPPEPAPRAARGRGRR